MPKLESITKIPSLPTRPADSHKGTYGTVIVVGGCTTMIGAPALCASAALRSGAGLVKIAASLEVIPVAIGIEPSATGIILNQDPSDHVRRIDEADPNHQAILAIGPGMGLSKNTYELVIALLRGKRTIVLDADGLNLLAKHRSPRSTPGPPLILTPHPGEYARLAQALDLSSIVTRDEDRVMAASQLATRQQAIVVLKGAQTVVTDGQRVYINHTGNPALATAGTGDVLTGIMAGMIAQKMLPFDAAILSVYLHGLTADIWSERYGCSGLTARDLIGLFPETLHRHRTRDNT